MKISKQITDVEHVLTDSDSIVSNTDLKGVITYANDGFVRLSGYSREELIGAPHNIVRHPDMPKEAFADLWALLKAGRPWTGIVKNRCKNGDYYWVLANVTPIYENTEMVGYMSVRSKPNREQVKAAETAYRLFNEGKACNLKIQSGKVVNVNFWSRLKCLKDCNIKFRLSAIIGLLSMLVLVIGGMGLFGINKAKEDLHIAYQTSLLPISQIASIQNLLLVNRSNISSNLGMSQLETTLRNTAETEQNNGKSSKFGNAYMMAASSTNNERSLTDKVIKDDKYLAANGIRPTVMTLRSCDMAQAQLDEINRHYPMFGTSIQQLMQTRLDMASQVLDAAQQRYETINIISIILTVVGVALAFWQGFLLIRAIINPLDACIAHFRQIAQGKYNNGLEIECHNEIGKVMEAIKSMQTRLGFDVAETRRIADENLLVKNALDNVSTGVMIADNSGKIIYANRSVYAILNKAQESILKDFPDFSADNLVGSKLGNFHAECERHMQLLDSLTNTYVAGINLGDRSIAVTVNPVINDQGERLGSVVEWQDRTDEVAVEKEVSTIVVASSMGDFSKRFDLHGKTGFLRELGEGLNQMLYTCESGLNEMGRVLGALSRGDLTETITNDYQGTLGQLKNDSNTTVEKLKEIIYKIRDATSNINAGSEEIASGNNDLSYRTEQQAASVEQTVANMNELTSIVQANTANAKHANQFAIAASEITGKGEIIVGQVVTTIDELNDASHKIADIISVIDDIAFQTNILAFNAAVEAARAGEYGQGFAVVAAEVRHLAQRASLSSGEIKSLIEDSVKKINSLSKLATQAGNAMEEILSSVQSVAGMMSDITAASVEQSAGIEQINLAIEQMDTMTQQNAALVEQAAAAAESLKEQAQDLAMTVNCFKLDKLTSIRFKSPEEEDMVQINAIEDRAFYLD
ncbi:MAG: methyl-accepting chemotaxis protein [Methylobacter sp.]